MKKLRKLIAIVALTAMTGVPSQNADGEEYCTSAGGCAYEDAYQSCCLAPAIGLAIAGIAIIIAVGVHNRNKSSHAH